MNAVTKSTPGRVAKMHARMRRFLTVFEKVKMISKACEIARVSRSSVLQWRKADREFSRAYEEIDSSIGEALEAESFRRGVLGVERDVRWQGSVVGTEVVYSDALLMQALRARHPAFKE